MAGRFSIEAIFRAVDRVSAPISRMQNRVGRFTRSMERGLRSANRVLSGITRGLGRGAAAVAKYGVIGIGAVTGAVALLVREFSKIENAQAAFQPLLGSAKKAKEAVDAINETAASTPFQFETLADSVNQLLPVMNGSIEDVITTVRMLGDTAGGNAQKLGSITRGFTKAMLKGKVDMESLNMIAEAGVPIFGDLADVMGVEMGDAFFKMVSAGKVGTKDLTKAFQRLTGEGGKFFNGMDIASKTMTGLFSTLKDNISLTSAELGSVLAPIIKDLTRGAIVIAQKVRAWVAANKELIALKVGEFVDGLKTRIKALVEQVVAFNSEYNIADLLGSGLDKIGKFAVFLKENGMLIVKLIAGIVALSLVVKTLTIIMAAFNLIVSLNPIALIVLAIAALVAGVILLINHFGGFEKVGQNVMDAWSDVGDFFSDLWGGVTDTFADAWNFIGGIVDKIKGAVDFVANAASRVSDAAGNAVDSAKNTVSDAASKVSGFFGFGGGADNAQQIAGGGSGQMVSPQERIARSVEETRSTSSSEVTIRDETGRAQVTRGKMGAGLKLQQSGAFD